MLKRRGECATTFVTDVVAVQVSTHIQRRQLRNMPQRRGDHRHLDWAQTFTRKIKCHLAGSRAWNERATKGREVWDLWKRSHDRFTGCEGELVLSGIQRRQLRN